MKLTEREDRSDDVSYEHNACQSTRGVVSVSIDDIGQDGVDDAEETVGIEQTNMRLGVFKVASLTTYPNPTQAKPI
jgi:hypothetical protein